MMYTNVFTYRKKSVNKTVFNLMCLRNPSKSRVEV